jgi:mono/diheme cytochrome c family protein
VIGVFVVLLTGCGGGETVSPTGSVEGTLPKQEVGDPAAGKTVFADTGCGSCHAFKAAGSKGTIGPDLDKSLQGKDEDYVRVSIVEPNAQIADGFQPNVMPQNYGQQLDSKEIADLVAFLLNPPKS